MPGPTEQERRLKRLFYRAEESVKELERLVQKIPDGADQAEAQRELGNLTEFIKEVKS
jgi:hypothetical protein